MNAQLRAETIRKNAEDRAQSAKASGSIWPVVAGHLGYEITVLCREIEGLKKELDDIKGKSYVPDVGGFALNCPFAGASVLVDFEDEDGAPLCAMINGRWVNQDQFPESIVDAWRDIGSKHAAWLKYDRQLREAEDRDL